MPLPPALLANTCCASPKSWTNRIQRHNPMHRQCAAAGMSPYGWLHLVVKSRQAQGLSEVSIMPLAAISRISSSAACRLARGSLWGRKRMGAAGPVPMLCCTRAVLVQSSSRAAKMSTKSLNRCRSCSCCGVLRCSTFRQPNSSTATTVSGDGEADGVCGGNGWGVLVWATIFLQGSPWVSLALVRRLGAGAGEHWCLGGGCGAVASPWWLQPDRSGTVLLRRHRAAPGISTHAPQWANKSKPTMHSSLMSTSQNSWRVWLIPTTTVNSFFPGITVLSPVTVSSSVLVGVQSSGRGLAVPDSKWWTPYSPGCCRAARQPHSPGTVLWQARSASQ